MKADGISKISAAAQAATAKYNTAVTDLGTKVAKSCADAINGASPSMVVRAQYKYVEGSRDNGSPGWNLLETMILEVQGISFTGSAGFTALDGMDVSASIPGFAEITLKVPIKIGANIEATGPAEKPLAGTGTDISPPNKPTAKTTYEPTIVVKASGKGTVQSLVTVSMSGAAEANWSVGELTFTLNAEAQ